MDGSVGGVGPLGSSLAGREWRWGYCDWKVSSSSGLTVMNVYFVSDTCPKYILLCCNAFPPQLIEEACIRH